MQKLRWLGAFTMTVAVTLHTLNIYPWNVYVQMVGAVIWIYAGTTAKDWALVSNFVPIPVECVRADGWCSYMDICRHYCKGLGVSLQLCSAVSHYGYWNDLLNLYERIVVHKH